MFSFFKRKTAKEKIKKKAADYFLKDPAFELSEVGETILETRGEYDEVIRYYTWEDDFYEHIQKSVSEILYIGCWQTKFYDSFNDDDKHFLIYLLIPGRRKMNFLYHFRLGKNELEIYGYDELFANYPELTFSHFVPILNAGLDYFEKTLLKSDTYRVRYISGYYKITPIGEVEKLYSSIKK